MKSVDIATHEELVKLFHGFLFVFDDPFWDME